MSAPDSFATALRCIECGAELPLDYRLECAACRGLLELVYDSLVDSDITVDTPEGPVRLLEFRGPDSTVELALAPVGDRCDVVGRVDPPGVRSAQVHTPSVVLAAVIEEDGGFVATGVPHGPMSVRLYLGGGARRVHTDWVAV